jgi:hypothetical protein
MPLQPTDCAIFIASPGIFCASYTETMQLEGLGNLDVFER